MSTPEPQWNPEILPPKSSNRKLWWIVGCAGFGVLALLTLGILATIIVPNVMAHLFASRQAKVEADLHEAYAAVEEYRALHGAYPSSWNDLLATGQEPERDPWGNHYVLLAGEDLQTRPRLFSYGRDGAFGGDRGSEDEDIEYIPR